MTAPAVDPIVAQIYAAICTAMATISQANGYYTDVAHAGIEPLAFDQSDRYPQIVLREETSTISDSNSLGYQDSVIAAAIGYLQIDATTGYAQALRLRDDMTSLLRGLTAKTFLDATGKQLVRTWAIGPQREIVPSDLAQGFLEVVVRIAFDYRDFTPPAKGI